MAKSDAFHFAHSFTQENPGSIEQKYCDVQGKKLGASALGEGSYGSVCKAKHIATGNIRALKTIDIKTAFKPMKDGPNKGKPDMTRFEAEVNIQKRLDHPNIVKLFEVFKDIKKVYLVMEICEGGELFDRIQDMAESVGFSEHQAAVYMKQILSAINYMHKLKIAHRDIKPENFLLQDKSKEAEIKVIDFGLGIEYKDKGNPPVMSTKAGTPYYVAPQVLDGKYSHKCDIWSCGVIAYILLCGYPPFYGDSDKEILDGVKKGIIEFPDEDWGQVSKAAKDFIKVMLTMAEAKRPEAADLLDLEFLNRECPAGAVITLSKGSIDNLKKFNGARRFKKVCLTMIATQLKQGEIEVLRKQFIALDRNQDGTISNAELTAALKGSKVSEKDILAITSGLDTDGSDDIDYTEFLAAIIDKKTYTASDALWTAFRTFDLDGDGKITTKELQTVLASDGHNLDVSKAKAMILEGDSNGDGVIDYDEFEAMMLAD